MTDTKKQVVVVSHDEYAENPISKEYQDGVMVKFALFHNRHNLMNDTNFNTSEYTSWDEMKKAIVKEYNPVIILPVSMYDHSGQILSFGNPTDRWDSGRVGFAFVTKETLKKLGCSKWSKGKILKSITNELKLYNAWRNGEVYRYEFKEETYNEKGYLIDEEEYDIGTEYELLGEKEVRSIFNIKGKFELREEFN